MLSHGPASPLVRRIAVVKQRSQKLRYKLRRKLETFHTSSQVYQAWLSLLTLVVCMTGSIYGTLSGHFGAIAVIPVDLVGLCVALACKWSLS